MRPAWTFLFSAAVAAIPATVAGGETTHLFERKPKVLEATAAADLRGQRLTLEVGPAQDLVLGVRRFIAPKDELDRLRDQIGSALVIGDQDHSSVSADSLPDPAREIAALIGDAMVANFGMQSNDAEAGGQTASDGVVLSVQPKYRQLYRHTAFVDPAFAYLVEISVLKLPGRTRLVRAVCAYRDSGASPEKPYLLNYFSNNAARLSANLDRVRDNCVQLFLERSLGLRPAPRSS